MRRPCSCIVMLALCIFAVYLYRYGYCLVSWNGLIHLFFFLMVKMYFRLRTIQCSNRLLESYIRRTRHHCTFHTNINFLSCSESGLLSIDKAVSIMYISVCLHTRECLSNNLHRWQTPTFTASLHLELQGLCQWLTLL